MLEFVTLETGKFVKIVNEKRQEKRYSKKWFIKHFC